MSEDWPVRAGQAARALHGWYRPATGLWRTAGWWNSANALTAIARYISVTGDRSYTGVISRTFRRARLRHRGFVNGFYDDCGWWALAWLDCHDLTGDPEHLNAARNIFGWMCTGWDEGGGGMWWSTKREYRNAITIELFFSVAARLAERAADPRYRDWAQRAWAWFAASGLTGESGLVNDGLTAAGENNGRTTWTYNQGVLLGGLAALHRVSGDPGPVARGVALAEAALGQLCPGGILTEPGEREALGRQSPDRAQFKGIFVRNLADFAVVCPRRADRYRAFLHVNADSAWRQARDGSDRFGLSWSSQADRADAVRQTSALDLLVAACQR